MGVRWTSRDCVDPSRLALRVGDIGIEAGERRVAVVHGRSRMDAPRDCAWISKHITDVATSVRVV